MRILYLEDNRQDAELAEKEVSRQRPAWNVALARDLGSARALLADGEGWDLVLADLRLQGGSGLDLLAEIRDRSLPVAVVILPGQGDETSAVAAVKAGADEYLLKDPGYVERLPSALEGALARFRARHGAGTGPLRVLYAEHHPMDVDLTRRNLAERAPHIRIEMAGDAQEVLARLPADPGSPLPFDLLLLDYRLPGLNALELLAILRRERGLDIPVVVVTGQGDHEVASRALQEGATDYVVKHPHYLFQLPAVLENAHHRVRLERERGYLRESEVRYRQLFEANPLPMWVYDTETLAFLAVNRAAVECYGYSQEEFLEMTIADIRPPEDVPRLLENVEAVTEESLDHAGIWRHRTKDGTLMEVEITSHPLTFQGRRAELVLANDVTQRLRAEAQLRMAQRMESVGRLAGGIAHDFNNLLTVILGVSDLMAVDLEPDHSLAKPLEQIRETALRAAALTRQLLAFGSRQVVRPEVLELNQIVLEMEPLLRRLIGEDIHVRMDLDFSSGPVKVDPVQGQQILMNLAVNARDAMPGGGTLTFRTGAVEVEGEGTGHGGKGLQPGSYAFLSVTDTGEGMDAGTVERIFDPFFTTKEPGRGTGLGLATVYGIVQQAGGGIEVASRPGEGATFRILLPRVVGEPAQGSDPAGTPPNASPGREASESVLVVEGDLRVRDLLEEALERSGYRVASAASGVEALALLDRSGEEVDLVVLDLAGADDGGVGLLRRLREMGPRLRVLLTTGYPEGRPLPAPDDLSWAHHLQKPFSAQDLLRGVREALREPEHRENGTP